MLTLRRGDHGYRVLHEVSRVGSAPHPRILKMAADDAFKPVDRGLPLVATPLRWFGCAVALFVLFLGAVRGYIVFSHSERTFLSFAWLFAVFALVEAGILYALLNAEEWRLARELRTARSGTAVLRGIAARRRQEQPFLARLVATRLGAAAVLLADSDREGAIEVLSRSSPLMAGGRLAKLRGVIEADLERANGTSVELERCIGRLRDMDPIGNREADRYRTHVLVKAVLEHGDDELATELAAELAESDDDEQRVYVAWLRAWFDLDAEPQEDGSPWPPLPEGDLRMAALLARSHGAQELVSKLDERVAAIAQDAAG
jgi:hypothetical protein